MNPTDCQAFLFVGPAHGVYDAQLCAYKLPELVEDGWRVENVAEEDLMLLRSGMADQLYYDTWRKVMLEAVLFDRAGNKWDLRDNLGIWLVPFDMEWDAEVAAYVWPKEKF